MPSCILVGIDLHNIPSCTPQSGYHGVTKVAKNAEIAKIAENCINYTRPTSTQHKPYEVGTRKHFFGSKSKKTKRFVVFGPKKGGVIFNVFQPPPTLPPPSKKWFPVVVAVVVVVVGV